MKKAKIALITLPLLALAAFFAFGGLDLLSTGKNDAGLAYNTNSPAYQYKKAFAKEEAEKKAKKAKKGIKPALEYMQMIRQNQDLGYVPMDAVIAAKQQYKKLVSKQIESAASKNGAVGLGLVWEELGPDNVGGRTRAIVIDKNNPNRMYAGGVSGGLFVSENGGNSWAPHPWTLEDHHVGISCMVQASDGSILIGTGEGYAPHLQGLHSFFGAPGFIGDGMYRILPDGVNWEKLTGTDPTTPNVNSDMWSFVFQVAVAPQDPNLIYAATWKGLQVSTDGGITFTPAQGIPAQYQNYPCYDVVVNGDGVVYAAMSTSGGINSAGLTDIKGNRYFRSANGIIFDDFAGQGNFPGPTTNQSEYNSTERMKFAVTPQDPNYVYALLAADNRLQSLYQSTDQGLTWTRLVVGDPNGFNPTGQQGTWNIAFNVDPFNKERVIIGGQLELWSWNTQGNRDLIAYWQPDSPTNPYYVHADMHCVTWHPTDPNIMYVGNDGGVYKTNNAQDQFPRFTARNKGYNVTQFYGIGTSINGFTMGGTQDNGTNYNDCTNNTPISFREVNGGDGGDAEISNINPNAMFAEVYGGAVRRSSNGGESFGGFFDENIDGDGDGGVQSLFLAPFALWEDQYDSVFYYTKNIYQLDYTGGGAPVKTLYDTYTDSVVLPVEKSIFFLGTTGNLWFTPDALDFSNTPRWYRIGGMGGTVSEIEITDDGLVFTGSAQTSSSVGSGGGTVVRIQGIPQKYGIDTIILDIVETPDTGNANITYLDTIFEYKVVPAFGNPAGWNSSANGVVSDNIFSRSGRFLTGISVNDADPNHVVISYGNYGNTDYVFRSENAMSASPTFTSLSGPGLPAMPIYDVLIDYYDPNKLILGTELGIWTAGNALDAPNNIVWNSENGQTMTSMPVFTLRQDPLYDMDCRVIYAGTHGRGMFRTTTLTPNTCDVTPCKNIVSTGPEPTDFVEVNSLSIYPVPVTDMANIEFNLNKQMPVTIQVVDVSGRVVMTKALQNVVAGKNTHQFDFSNLTPGVYVVATRIAGDVLTRKIVKH